jgi:hypothetical protein
MPKDLFWIVQNARSGFSLPYKLLFLRLKLRLHECSNVHGIPCIFFQYA